MNLRLLSIALLTLIGFSNIVNANIWGEITKEFGKQAIEWPTVDIRNNKIGLHAERCKFNHEADKIVCETTTGHEITIEDVEAKEVHSGTPPWLQFHNYIGLTEGGKTPGLVGSGKRTIYLKK